MNHDRIRIGGIALLFAGLCLATLVIALGACTAAEQTTANTIVQQACIPVVSLTPAALESGVICVVVDDLLAEVEAYELAHAGAKGVATTPNGVTVVPEVYAGLTRRTMARALAKAGR